MMSSVATMTPARSRCMVTVRTYAERERFMQRRQQLEQQHAAQVSAGLALSAARERGLRVERDRQDSQEAEREVTRLVRRNGPRHPPPPLPAPATQLQDEQSAPAVPPPPPAAPVAPASAVITTPSSASSQTPVTKVVTKPPLPSSAPPAPPASPPAATTTFRVNKIAASSAPQRGPSPAPYCPTPDYDSDSSGSTLHTTSTSWTAHGAKGPVVGKVPGPGATVPEVEMQSMDSLELLEPRPKEPRPPQTYFQHQPASRPSVCVTIREYGASSSRQPSKLSFLHSRPQQNGSGLGAKDVDGLQSELATTLSRSNLRSRTDLTESSNEGHPKEAEEAPKLSEDVPHGNVTVTSINGNSSAPYLPKNSMPNGILKKASVSLAAPNGMPVGHGITPAILAGAGAALNRTKSNGVPTKTISFGAKATIINEKQVSS